MSTIKKGSKEFYEVVESFESSIRSLPVFTPNDFSKEDKNKSNAPSTYFYCNGQINSMFLVFMAGYVAAKKEYQQ